jgi:Tfp pilus assembly protein PilF
MSTIEARTRAANAVARAHREAGEVELASYLYAHSLEWDETAEARLGLAFCYAYSGQMERALDECRRAVKVDPDDGRASNDLGVYLMQLGDDESAVPHLMQSVAAPINPERHHPHYNLGRIFERRKNYIAAVDAYQAAVDAAPDFAAAQKALERVQRKVQGTSPLD